MKRNLTPMLIVVAMVVAPIVGGAQESVRMTGPAGIVTLSRIEHDRLLDLATHKPAPPEPAPVPAALARAALRVRVDGAFARASMQVDGEVFRSGVAKVPLIKGATLLEARSDSRPLPLIAEGDVHFALLAGPTRFSAILEVGTPRSLTPGRGAFTLPVPIAGSATAEIDVPGDQTDIHLSNGIVLTRSSAGGRTIVEATLDPGTPTQVWWSTRESAPTQPSARDVRLLCDVKTLVSIGQADVRLVTLVDVTVVQGEPSQIELLIPPGYEVNSVSGASLERTETRPDGLVLVVADPTQRRHQFLVALERQNGGGSFKLETSFPTISAARRETGEVAVEGLGTLEIHRPRCLVCGESMCAKWTVHWCRPRDNRCLPRIAISALQTRRRRWWSTSGDFQRLQCSRRSRSAPWRRRSSRLRGAR